MKDDCQLPFPPSDILAIVWYAIHLIFTFSSVFLEGPQGPISTTGGPRAIVWETLLYGIRRQAGPASALVVPGERSLLKSHSTGSLSLSICVPTFMDAAHGHFVTYVQWPMDSVEFILIYVLVEEWRSWVNMTAQKFILQQRIILSSITWYRIIVEQCDEVL